MIHSLTFDPGKMYIFLFQLTFIYYKKNLQTVCVINTYMFQEDFVKIL